MKKTKSRREFGTDLVKAAVVLTTGAPLSVLKVFATAQNSDRHGELSEYMRKLQSENPQHARATVIDDKILADFDLDSRQTPGQARSKNDQELVDAAKGGINLYAGELLGSKKSTYLKYVPTQGYNSQTLNLVGATANLNADGLIVPGELHVQDLVSRCFIDDAQIQVVRFNLSRVIELSMQRLESAGIVFQGSHGYHIHLDEAKLGNLEGISPLGFFDSFNLYDSTIDTFGMQGRLTQFDATLAKIGSFAPNTQFSNSAFIATTGEIPYNTVNSIVIGAGNQEALRAGNNAIGVDGLIHRLEFLISNGSASIPNGPKQTETRLAAERLMDRQVQAALAQKGVPLTRGDLRHIVDLTKTFDGLYPSVKDDVAVFIDLTANHKKIAAAPGLEPQELNA